MNILFFLVFNEFLRLCKMVYSYCILWFMGRTGRGTKVNLYMMMHYAHIDIVNSLLPITFLSVSLELRDSLNSAGGVPVLGSSIGAQVWHRSIPRGSGECLFTIHADTSLLPYFFSPSPSSISFMLICPLPLGNGFG